MNAADTHTGKSLKKQTPWKRFWSKTWTVTKKVGRVIIGRTIPQKLFRLYFLIVIVGALFLSAPFCLQKIYINGEWVQANGFTNATGKAGGTNYTFIQALFIACSGFSDTGLTPVPIYLWLNDGGQVVLMILIEIGGIGIVALFYYVWNIFKKKEDKIDVGQLFIMQAERGGAKMKDSFRVIKTALLFILATQVVFMFIFSFCFCFIPAYHQLYNTAGLYPGTGISWDDKNNPLPLCGNYGRSLWTALFTTVSAMNNAGFDNISADSMAPYRNDLGIILQFFVVLELIIGGLGHFAAFDYIEKIRCKRKHLPYKITLYTKVAVSVYFIVAVIGMAGALAFEFTNPWISGVGPGTDEIKQYTIIGNFNKNGEFGEHPMFNKIMCIIFHSFNCRSLGMETVKTDFVAEGSKWVYCILMFIGASPCSTAGGIRTTTLAVIFVTIWCKLCGRKNVFFFKRRINQETVTSSFMIFIIALILLLIGVLLVWSATPDKRDWIFSEFLVECCSAFGTVGLSTGLTSVIKWWGLLYLVILMFVGQLGVINTLLSWTKFHPHFNDIEYPYEDIKIG